MAQEPIRRILASIDSGNADAAWRRFLDAYSSRLANIVKQFEAEDELARDCYDFVCAHLSDNEFRRLRSFDPAGPARFATWLTAVVANLCRDWRRSRNGRHRVPECVKRLSDLDQLVFDLVYRQALTMQECLLVLRASMPGFADRNFHESHARLQGALSARQRWQFSTKRSKRSTIDPDLLDSGGPDPETSYLATEDSARLKKALARLDPDDRLILLLRYQQGLTYREISVLLDVRDLFATRRAIDRALKKLRKVIKL